jgi:hypothetical protein
VSISPGKSNRLSSHVEHESTIEASAFSHTLKNVKQLLFCGAPFTPIR